MLTRPISSNKVSAVITLIAAILACAPSLAQVDGGNPALRVFSADTALSEVSVVCRASSRLMSSVEEGDKWRSVSAEGRADMRISDGWRAWGDAAYGRSVRAGVRWSESSDVAEVWPMAVADTVGGDKDGESYAFRAGFAWSGRGGGAGLEVSYSSLCEFRMVDPRPKSDAVSAEVRLGGAWQLKRASLGAFGLLRKYSQDVDIDFYNVQGARATIYHMTGLGTDYSRFAGAYDEAVFKGRTVGGGLQFRGFANAQVEFSHRHMEKILPDVQNALISETLGDRLSFEMSRPGVMGGWQTGLSVFGSVKRLNLKTIIYDDGAKGYRQIAVRQPYEQKGVNVGLAALMRKDGVATLRAAASYGSHFEENTDARREIDVKDVRARLSVSRFIVWRRVDLACGGGVYGRVGVGKRCVLGAPRRTESHGALLAVLHNYQLRSASLAGVDADVRADLRLPRLARSAFLSVSGGWLWRSGGLPSGWVMSARAGVSF